MEARERPSATRFPIRGRIRAGRFNTGYGWPLRIGLLFGRRRELGAHWRRWLSRPQFHAIRRGLGRGRGRPYRQVQGLYVIVFHISYEIRKFQAPRRDSRYWEGATPTRRLKVRLKWLWSQKPAARAIWIIGVSDAASS